MRSAGSSISHRRAPMHKHKTHVRLLLLLADLDTRSARDVWRPIKPCTLARERKSSSFSSLLPHPRCLRAEALVLLLCQNFPKCLLRASAAKRFFSFKLPRDRAPETSLPATENPSVTRYPGRDRETKRDRHKGGDASTRFYLKRTFLICLLRRPGSWKRDSANEGSERKRRMEDRPLKRRRND